jgi:hypothetical protein
VKNPTPEIGSIIGVKNISQLGLKEARCHRVCPVEELIYQKAVCLSVTAMSKFLAHLRREDYL